MIKFRNGKLSQKTSTKNGMVVEIKIKTYDDFELIKKNIKDGIATKQEIKEFIKIVNKMEELLEGDAMESNTLRYHGGWQNMIFEE